MKDQPEVLILLGLGDSLILINSETEKLNRAAV